MILMRAQRLLRNFHILSQGPERDIKMFILVPFSLEKDNLVSFIHTRKYEGKSASKQGFVVTVVTIYNMLLYFTDKN